MKNNPRRFNKARAVDRLQQRATDKERTALRYVHPSLSAYAARVVAHLNAKNYLLYHDDLTFWSYDHHLNFVKRMEKLLRKGDARAVQYFTQERHQILLERLTE